MTMVIKSTEHEATNPGLYTLAHSLTNAQELQSFTFKLAPNKSELSRCTP